MISSFIHLSNKYLLSACFLGARLYDVCWGGGTEIDRISVPPAPQTPARELTANKGEPYLNDNRPESTVGTVKKCRKLDF